MSTHTSRLHRGRHITARCFGYGALLSFVLFLYYIVTNFGGSGWAFWGFGAIALLIIANVVSHPSSSDTRAFLPPKRDDRA